MKWPQISPLPRVAAGVERQRAYCELPLPLLPLPLLKLSRL